MNALPLWNPIALGPPEFVLHPSVVLAWSFAGTSSVYASDVMRRMISTVPVVPAFWPLQVADELLTAERNGVGTRLQVERFLTGLYRFQIHIDGEATTRAFGDILDLARAHNLSVPDAAYLELALRLNLPLATSDRALTRAANSAGATTFTP